MKTKTQQPETTDYTDCTDKNIKPYRDTALRVPRPKSKAARRKQFMREYRRLYKETKRFVDEVLRQYSHKATKDLGKGKGMVETNPLASLIKYTLRKARSAPNGSGIISASRQSSLCEIVEGIIAHLKSDKNKINVSKWVKRPHHCLTFDNGFKIYFRPATFRGEAYRGIHVDTFAIMYEVEMVRDIAIWNEFYRAMIPGCDGRTYYG